MPESSHSAPSAKAPQVPAYFALTPPRRPDELTEEVAGIICNIIRLDGIADHFAAAMMGVTRAAFLNWKESDQAFALKLDLARALFERELMRRIGDARRADGTPDWRAQQWLLKNTCEEGIIKAGRTAKERRAKQAAVTQKHANLPETPAAAREHASNVPETHAATAPAQRCAPENAANLPETHAQPGQVGAPLTGRIAPTGEKTTILPETPRPASAPMRRAA